MNNDIQRIIEYYKNHKSISKTSKEFGKARETIRKILVDNNVEIDKTPQKKKITISADKLSNLYNDLKMSFLDISKETGIPLGQIGKLLKECNILPRDPCQAIDIPDKNELLGLYQSMSLVDLGKHYNVSNVTVAKWFKKLGIEQRKTVIVADEAKPLFLTEKNLYKFLRLIFDEDDIVHDKQFMDTRYRPDYLIKSKKLIVEFNGYHHYANPSTILRDEKKYTIYKEAGYALIQIPYFIQLDIDMFVFFFGEDARKEYKELMPYPHGFVDTDVFLPSQFCALGLDRFVNDFKWIPTKVKHDIVKSIVSKIKECVDIRYIIPQYIYNEILEKEKAGF